MAANSLTRSAAVATYVAGLKPKNTDDPMSLCSLLARKVSQSTNIRLGNELEVIYNKYAVAHCDVADLRPPKCGKGQHQKDFLVEVLGDTIVYGEFKSNINLDTEKRKATREKVNAVCAELRATYPGKKVCAFLVSLRYLHGEDIPPATVASYHDVTLVGIGEFFRTVLKHPVEELATYESYSRFLMTVVDRLEPPSNS
jgi:hypothetical protein